MAPSPTPQRRSRASGRNSSRKPTQLTGRFRHAAIDRGYELLGQGGVDEAIEFLEKALEVMLNCDAPKDPTEMAAPSLAQPHEKARSGSKTPRSGSKATAVSSASPSRASPSRADTEEEFGDFGGPQHIAGVVQLLCICYSKKQDWEAIRTCTSVVLDSEAKAKEEGGFPLPCQPPLKEDLHLRRAVALSHLAGLLAADDGGEGLDHAKIAQLLELADADLAKVKEKNPNNKLLRSCLGVVDFLQVQMPASGAAPEPEDAVLEVGRDVWLEEGRSGPRSLRGLERIRAVSP